MPLSAEVPASVKKTKLLTASNRAQPCSIDMLLHYSRTLSQQHLADTVQALMDRLRHAGYQTFLRLRNCNPCKIHATRTAYAFAQIAQVRTDCAELRTRSKE